MQSPPIEDRITDAFAVTWQACEGMQVAVNPLQHKVVLFAPESGNQFGHHIGVTVVSEGSRHACAHFFPLALAPDRHQPLLAPKQESLPQEGADSVSEFELVPRFDGSSAVIGQRGVQNGVGLFWRQIIEGLHVNVKELVGSRRVRAHANDMGIRR